MSNITTPPKVPGDQMTAEDYNNFRTAINTKADQDDLLLLETQKQDALSSGVNIKTINGQNILGSGDLSVGGSITIDAVPTDGSSNAVSSNGTFDALAGKAALNHTHPLSALTQSGATAGQVPKWNGTAWAPANDNSGGGGGANVAYATRSEIAALTASDGQYVYLAEEGREGGFVFYAGDYSAQVTSDPRQAVYIAPAADTDGSTGVWMRERAQHVNIKWFGAKGDGMIDVPNNTATGTDDTSAFQDAIQFLQANGGGTLFVPNGVFIISSPHNTANGSYAQIWLPMISEVYSTVSIRILGETPAVMSPTYNSGSIICSPLNTDLGNVISSVIGVEGTVGRTWLNFYMENITIRTPQASHHSGLDLRRVHAASVYKCRIDVIGGIENEIPDLALPTFPLSYGIVGGNNFTPLWNIVEETLLFGYYYGCRVGELHRSDNIAISGCVYVAELPECAHPSSFGRMLVLSCVNGLHATGHHHVLISLYNTEHTPLPAGWPGRGADIVDPDSLLRGFMQWHMHEEGEFVINGATNMEIRYYKSYQTSYYKPFEGIQSIITRSGLCEVYEGRDDRYPWISVYGNRAGANDLVGAQSFSNHQKPGVEKRIAQISASNFGSLDNGKLDILTARNGTLEVGASVTSEGFELPGVKHITAQLNGDLAGYIELTNATSASKTFAVPYTSPQNFVPVVVATPGVQLPAGVTYWVEAGVGGFTLYTSAPVSVYFAYMVIGRRNY